MSYFVGVVIGIVLSFIVHKIYGKRSTDGVLKIDTSNPEKDIYRLDIDDLDILPRKKYLVLTIDTNVDLSQK